MRNSTFNRKYVNNKKKIIFKSHKIFLFTLIYDSCVVGSVFVQFFKNVKKFLVNN